MPSHNTGISLTCTDCFPDIKLLRSHTPQFADAARKTLELRGDGGTGWSKGWKINVWARLHDGNHAHKLIREQLTLTGVEGTNYAKGGGTYPNLLDAHPHFKLMEILAAHQVLRKCCYKVMMEPCIFFPALPDEWASGKVTGLKARGGFTVDIAWKEGKITELKIKSAIGGNCRLRVSQPLRSVALAKGENKNDFYKSVQPMPAEATVSVKGKAFYLYDLNTVAGKEYILIGR